MQFQKTFAILSYRNVYIKQGAHEQSKQNQIW